VGPLSLSLSPSKGERVPARVGEGPPMDSPSLHGSGRVRPGQACFNPPAYLRPNRLRGATLAKELAFGRPLFILPSAFFLPLGVACPAHDEPVMPRRRPGDTLACTRCGSRNPLYLQGIHTTFCLQRALRYIHLQVGRWMLNIGTKICG